MGLIKTTRFGDLSVSPEDIIELPKGLIGFTDLKQFVLLDHDKESPFKWLQSLDDGDIAFIIMNPLLIRRDYAVSVTEAEVSELSFEAEEDAVITVILTLPADAKQMTANFKAPLIFNLKNRKGKQVILENQEYGTRHNVVNEMSSLAENSKDTKYIKQAIEKGEFTPQQEL